MIVLNLPELAQRPVIAAGCCSVAAAEAIERALGEWRGVERVHVDPCGRVEVAVGADGPAPADLAWSLRMLGFDRVELADG